MTTTPIRIWDLPTRLCHWLLAILVTAAFVTAQIGGNLMEWHGRVGIAIGGVLAFRVTWGFVGSTYARFAQFMPLPMSVLRYMRGHWQGIGHNPLGALSVLSLLGVLAFQVGTGLVSNDDIAFEGSLYALVSKETSDWLSGLHRQNYWPILALVGLHLAAIVFYTRIRRESLVRPMITGVKQVPHAHARPASGGGPVAFIVALAVAAGAVWAAAGGLLPPPPPPPPAGSVPAW